VADHFVTLMLRQGDAEVFKRYSQAKLNMMREALDKLDRRANEHERSLATVFVTETAFGTDMRGEGKLRPKELNGTSGGIRTPDLLLRSLRKNGNSLILRHGWQP
jgi:hypothetical protein